MSEKPEIRAIVPPGLFRVGPLLEFMQMANGTYGERITHPDGTIECWLNGKACDPSEFETIGMDKRNRNVFQVV